MFGKVSVRFGKCLGKMMGGRIIHSHPPSPDEGLVFHQLYSRLWQFPELLKIKLYYHI